MDTISRLDAYEAGLKRFYTGRRCKRGHISERYVSSGNCIACHCTFTTERQETVSVTLRPELAALVREFVDSLVLADTLTAPDEMPKGAPPATTEEIRVRNLKLQLAGGGQYDPRKAP